MTCQHWDCDQPATEGVVLDLFTPTKVLCADHATEAVKLVQRKKLLPNLWWPAKGTKFTSRRYEYGNDWKPMKEYA